MKPLLALLLPFALAGCLAEVLTTTAIQGELAARDAQAAASAMRYAKESKAKTEAEYAIRAYQADTGSYPPSLAALVPGYLPGVPTHADGTPFGYDPATGRLMDGAATAQVPFTQEDGRNLKRIEDAIFAYWQATGDYPRALNDLAPVYMDAVPMLSAGGAFIYDPQTGAVYHPSDFQKPGGVAASSRTSSGGGGGAGPLGEATAGIGIQNQLRNMNTSGVSNAGGAARRGVGAANDAHNQAQQRALDEIDQ